MLVYTPPSLPQPCGSSRRICSSCSSLTFCLDRSSPSPISAQPPSPSETLRSCSLSSAPAHTNSIFPQWRQVRNLHQRLGIQWSWANGGAQRPSSRWRNHLTTPSRRSFFPPIHQTGFSCRPGIRMSTFTRLSMAPRRPHWSRPSRTAHRCWMSASARARMKPSQQGWTAK